MASAGPASAARGGWPANAQGTDSDGHGLAFAIVAPTFNNATTLLSAIRSAEELGFPVVVVNDGSTDATAELLRDWERGPIRNAGRKVVHHAQNRGKADAMRTGFAVAAGLGFSHAVTIDTDGQHDAGDVPALVAIARRRPDAIVVGARPIDRAVYPFLSRVGRSISNLMVYLESGVRICDSQCGMRVYPLARTTGLACAAGRYGFETEILARAAWAGVPVLEAPIRCIYSVPGGRVTHFRPLRDSAAACVMHARLLVESMDQRARAPVPEREVVAHTPSPP